MALKKSLKSFLTFSTLPFLLTFLDPSPLKATSFDGFMEGGIWQATPPSSNSQATFTTGDLVSAMDKIHMFSNLGSGPLSNTDKIKLVNYVASQKITPKQIGALSPLGTTLDNQCFLAGGSSVNERLNLLGNYIRQNIRNQLTGNLSSGFSNKSLFKIADLLMGLGVSGDQITNAAPYMDATALTVRTTISDRGNYIASMSLLYDTFNTLGLLAALTGETSIADSEITSILHASLPDSGAIAQKDIIDLLTIPVGTLSSHTLDNRILYIDIGTFLASHQTIYISYNLAAGYLSASDKGALINAMISDGRVNPDYFAYISVNTFGNSRALAEFANDQSALDRINTMLSLANCHPAITSQSTILSSLNISDDNFFDDSANIEAYEFLKTRSVLTSGNRSSIESVINQFNDISSWGNRMTLLARLTGTDFLTMLTWAQTSANRTAFDGATSGAVTSGLTQVGNGSDGKLLNILNLFNAIDSWSNAVNFLNLLIPLADKRTALTWAQSSTHRNTVDQAYPTGVLNELPFWGNGTDDNNLLMYLNRYYAIIGWGNLPILLNLLNSATDKQTALLWAQNSANHTMFDNLKSFYVTITTPLWLLPDNLTQFPNFSDFFASELSSISALTVWGKGGGDGNFLDIIIAYNTIHTLSPAWGHFSTLLNLLPSLSDKTAAISWSQNLVNRDAFDRIVNSSNPSLSAILTGLSLWGTVTNENILNILTAYVNISTLSTPWANFPNFLAQMSSETDRQQALIFVGKDASSNTAAFDGALSSGLIHGYNVWGTGSDGNLWNIFSDYNTIFVKNGWEALPTLLTQLTSQADKFLALAWASSSENTSLFDEATTSAVTSNITVYGSLTTPGSLIQVMNNYGIVNSAQDAMNLLSGFTTTSANLAALIWYTNNTNANGTVFNLINQSKNFTLSTTVRDISTVVNGLNGYQQLTNAFIASGLATLDNATAYIDTSISETTNARANRTTLAGIVFGHGLDANLTSSTTGKDLTSALIVLFATMPTLTNANILTNLSLINTAISETATQRAARIAMATSIQNSDGINLSSHVPSASVLVTTLLSNNMTGPQVAAVHSMIDTTVTQTESARATVIASAWTNYSAAGTNAPNIIALANTPATKGLMLSGYSTEPNQSSFAAAWSAGLFTGLTSETNWSTNIAPLLAKYRAAATDANNVLNLASTGPDKRTLLTGYNADANKANFAAGFTAGIFTGFTTETVWATNVGATLTNYTTALADITNLFSGFTASTDKRNALTWYVANTHAKGALLHTLSTSSLFANITDLSSITVAENGYQRLVDAITTPATSITSAVIPLVDTTVLETAALRALRINLSVASLSLTGTLSSGSTASAVISALMAANVLPSSITPTLITTLGTLPSETPTARANRIILGITFLANASLYGRITGSTAPAKDVITSLVSQNIQATTLTAAIPLVDTTITETATARANRILMALIVKTASLDTNITDSHASFVNDLINAPLTPSQISPLTTLIDTTASQTAANRTLAIKTLATNFATLGTNGPAVIALSNTPAGKTTMIAGYAGDVNKVYFAAAVAAGLLTDLTSETTWSSNISPVLAAYSAAGNNLTTLLGFSSTAAGKRAILEGFSADRNKGNFSAILTGGFVSDLTTETSWTNIGTVLSGYTAVNLSTWTSFNLLFSILPSPADKRAALAWAQSATNRTLFTQAYTAGLVSGSTVWGTGNDGNLWNVFSNYQAVQSVPWSNLTVFLNRVTLSADKCSALAWAQTSTNRNIFDRASTAGVSSGISVWGTGSDRGFWSFLNGYSVLLSLAPTSTPTILSKISDTNAFSTLLLDRQAAVFYFSDSTNGANRRTAFTDLYSILISDLTQWSLIQPVLYNYVPLITANWSNTFKTFLSNVLITGGATILNDKRTALAYFADSTNGANRQAAYVAANTAGLFSGITNWASIQPVIDNYAAASLDASLLLSGFTLVTDKRNALSWYTMNGGGKGSLFHALSTPTNLFASATDLNTITSSQNGYQRIVNALGSALSSAITPAVISSVSIIPESSNLRGNRINLSVVVNANATLYKNITPTYESTLNLVSSLASLSVLATSITPTVINVLGSNPSIEVSTSRATRIKSFIH